MRSLPMLLRLAEEMTRMPRVTPFSSPIFSSFFNEPSWVAFPTVAARWQKGEWKPVHVGKNGYQVSLDVSEYKPSELTVKTVDNSVVIEGKSENQEDPQGGFSSRHFVRRFTLPQGYEPEKAMSTLSSDGVLTISVPNPAGKAEEANERNVPIQHTGPAHLNIKENPAVKEPKEPVKAEEKQK